MITYVNRKSDLTAYMEKHEAIGYKAYRTRLTCQCKTPFNFRYGVLIINGNMVIGTAVRCKACAKKGGAQ